MSIGVFSLPRSDFKEDPSKAIVKDVKVPPNAFHLKLDDILYIILAVYLPCSITIAVKIVSFWLIEVGKFLIFTLNVAGLDFTLTSTYCTSLEVVQNSKRVEEHSGNGVET